MEHDIYDSLRLTATTCEKIADVLNAIAECFEKVTACLMDLIEEIKRQPLKMILQKLRPDHGHLCMADHYCVNTEDNLVHSVRNSAVR